MKIIRTPNPGVHSLLKTKIGFMGYQSALTFTDTHTAVLLGHLCKLLTMTVCFSFTEEKKKKKKKKSKKRKNKKHSEDSDLESDSDGKTKTLGILETELPTVLVSSTGHPLCPRFTL